MSKTIIKEVIIMLLLLLAIILALGVLFYDYVPVTKVVPTIEAYQTPNIVTESLQNDILADTTQVIITREIDQSDLSVYEQAKDYKKGKANPFETYKEPEVTTNKVNSAEAATNNEQNSQNNQTQNNQKSNVTNNIDSSKDNDFLANKTSSNGTK